jgi:hypothetical protein
MIELIGWVLALAAMLAMYFKATAQNRELYAVKIAAIEVVFAKRSGADQDAAIAKLAELVAPPGYVELMKSRGEWP